MGIIATLLALSRAKSDTKGNAPGKSAIAQGEGMDGQILTPEVYQAPGVYGIPPDGTRGVLVPVGGSGRYGVVIATHNYQVTIDVDGAGGMAIYSTSADGQTVKAKIVLKPDGKIAQDGTEIHLNGSTKKLVTADELQTALTALCGLIASHVHPETGTTTGPAPTLAGLGCDITAAKTTTIKTGG